MTGDSDKARLLVALAEDASTDRQIESALPEVPFAHATVDAQSAWPSVEAILAGHSRVPPAWGPGSFPNLRFVQSLFTGLDRFPFDRFAPSVLVAGNVGGYAPYVAERAIALLLAPAHDLAANYELVRRGQLRPAPTSRNLRGRTVLILGYGAIGRQVAERLRPFEVVLECVTRDGQTAPGIARTYPSAELTEALGNADMVVECRPLTDETRGTLDTSALGGMKEEAILVNVGRAATVDEEALYHRLVDQPKFRYATDVFWEEEFSDGGLKTRFPFTDLPNFLATPHNAALGKDARAYALGHALENLARFFRGEPPLYVADRAEYDSLTR